MSRLFVAPFARRAAVAVLLALSAVAAALTPDARADGDPGSDVLVYQDLFVGSTAAPSIPQQAQLGALLKAADRRGFPIRVAIIGGRSDLGAVTQLWRNPRAYARFLGLELSMAYKQRLLVVMPNGFGFNWPRHSARSAYEALAGVRIAGGGDGLLVAAQAAVRKLAAQGGVRLPSAIGASPTTGSGTAEGNSAPPASTPGQETDKRVATIFFILAAITAAAFAIRWIARRRPEPRAGSRARGAVRRLSPGGRRWLLPSVALVSIGAVAGVVAVAGLSSAGGSKADELAFNPDLDPGTPLSGPAPDFTLSDQFGKPVSLHSFRGKVVILAFNDSECTTECPLTTSAMLDAKAMLGKAGSRVQLLGVDANPAAISLEDVWSYSELHGMLHSWRFLTGSLPQLKRVWKKYAVQAAAERGVISHSPALFVIDPQGRRSKVYITQMSYTAVGQLGQVLANEASRLLPDHPPVHSDLSYSRVAPTAPADQATLPRAGGGSVSLGAGKSPRLYLFFATWDRQTSGLAGHLQALNRYQTIATRSGLPRLTAVDEASVEPDATTLTRFLDGLARPPNYPIAVDRSGKVADGYEVLGLPWFVLVSPNGKIIYYRETSTSGWPSINELIRSVRAALARAPKTSGARSPQAQLAGSPQPLASLHAQAGQVLGSGGALQQRLRSLRGYPVVINAWASWCGPCRTEFPLLASESIRYGRKVAFLGLDTNDSLSDARTFLASHPVSYPSYQGSTSQVRELLPQGLFGLPTTIFIDRKGKVSSVHSGPYESPGTLDQDVERYALGTAG